MEVLGRLESKDILSEPDFTLDGPHLHIPASIAPLNPHKNFFPAMMLQDLSLTLLSSSI